MYRSPWNTAKMIYRGVVLAVTSLAAVALFVPSSASASQDVVASVVPGCTRTEYSLTSDASSGSRYYTFRHDGEVVKSGALFAGQTVTKSLYELAGPHTSRIVVDGVVVAADVSGPCGYSPRSEWGPRR